MNKTERTARLVDAIGGGICRIHGEFIGTGKYHLRACSKCDVEAYYSKKSQIQTRIEQITAALEEYRDCHDELSAPAVARTIDTLYHEDTEIKENMEDYWMHQRCGAEQ